MKAFVLKKGRKTIAISIYGPPELWPIAASHYTGVSHWNIGAVPAARKKLMQADGWRVVPVEVRELEREPLVK